MKGRLSTSPNRRAALALSALGLSLLAAGAVLRPHDLSVLWFTWFLGAGLLLTGVLVIPINTYIEWLDRRAPAWFKTLGWYLMFFALIPVIVALLFLVEKL